MADLTREEALAFKADLLKLCEKHDVVLSHEDSHGHFLIERRDKPDVDCGFSYLPSSSGMLHASDYERLEETA